MYQNVTVGGQTPDKKDAVNRLSYLVLRSVAQTRLPQPNLTVRYHKGLPKEFMQEAIEVMKLGTGMPAFNNDEIIIPSFIDLGVKEEDAYNYSAIGCVETAVPGKWGYRCTGMSYMNFPRILLITMNDGIDQTTGKRFLKPCGKFEDMETYEDLKAAMLNKDMVAKTAIQMVKAAILLWEKDEKNIGKEVTDDVIIEIVSKELKKRKDSLGDFEKSGRADLIADLNREIEILQKYLPEQLSEEELTKIVEDAIKEVGAESIKQMGQVMKLVTPKVVGRADNKLVSEMIKSKLN